MSYTYLLTNRVRQIIYWQQVPEYVNQSTTSSGGIRITAGRNVRNYPQLGKIYIDKCLIMKICF